MLNLQKDHKETAEVAPLFERFRAQCGEAFVTGEDEELAAWQDGAIVFGFGPQATLRATEPALEPEGSRFEVEGIPFRVAAPGRHNAVNALAAIAACRALGVPLEAMAAPLERFAGVARRFQSLGVAGRVEVVDDFAHNPAKLRAAIATARGRANRVLAVYQPHGYGPTRFLRPDLVEAFAEALGPEDRMWMLEVFYAGGTARRDFSAADLVWEIEEKGRRARFAASREALVAEVSAEARPGDLVLVMGARDPSLTELGRGILHALTARNFRRFHWPGGIRSGRMMGPWEAHFAHGSRARTGLSEPMHSRISLILASALLCAVFGPAAAETGGSETVRSLELAALLRSCGTPDPSPQELERAHEATRRWKEERAVQGRRFGGTIPVAFHVITGGKLGRVTDAQIGAQIEALNRAFRATGYSFRLASVDRTDNTGFFRMVLGTGSERKAKQALAIDPAHRLNLYTCSPGQLLLGWAYYPWSFPEGHVMDGVVIHFGTVPGGSLDRYNQGGSAIHEVGHYLGLLHTFENGCEAPGDYVDDTPYEESPAFGCQEGRDTCTDPGLDPVHNYMDYSDDPCLTEFTTGQDARMDDIVPVYRASLLDANRAIASGGPEIQTETEHPFEARTGIEFRGAGPNPFRSETAVRFTLPRSERVSLRVYNVGGQLVRSLIDAQLPAGAHGALFAGKDLPAGLYFLRLNVGKTQMTRSVILLR